MIFETDSMYSMDALTGNITLGMASVQPLGLNAESTITDIDCQIEVSGIRKNDIIFYASAADTTEAAQIGYIVAEYSTDGYGLAIPSYIVEANPHGYSMTNFAENILLAQSDELSQFTIDVLIAHIRRRYREIV